MDLKRKWFKNYVTYVDELKHLLGTGFTQWIDHTQSTTNYTLFINSNANVGYLILQWICTIHDPKESFHLAFKPMEDINELQLANDERAAAVAKLFQLIEIDNEIIDLYRANGIDDEHVKQYLELRNENLKKLSQLLDAPKLKIQLTFDNAA